MHCRLTGQHTNLESTHALDNFTLSLDYRRLNKITILSLNWFLGSHNHKKKLSLSHLHQVTLFSSVQLNRTTCFFWTVSRMTEYSTIYDRIVQFIFAWHRAVERTLHFSPLQQNNLSLLLDIVQSVYPCLQHCGSNRTVQYTCGFALWCPVLSNPPVLSTRPVQYVFAAYWPCSLSSISVLLVEQDNKSFAGHRPVHATLQVLTSRKEKNVFAPYFI